MFANSFVSIMSFLSTLLPNSETMFLMISFSCKTFFAYSSELNTGTPNDLRILEIVVLPAPIPPVSPIL